MTYKTKRFLSFCIGLIALGALMWNLRPEPVEQTERLEIPSEILAPSPIEVHLPESNVRRCDNGLIYCDEIPLSDGWQCWTQECCRRYGVDYPLLLGLMETESSFRKDADSGWAFGICQIGYINAVWLAEDGVDIYTTQGNIEAACVILGDYLNRYDVPQALMAYNCGEYGAQELWAEGINETEYSRSVMAAAERWEETIHDRP